MKITITGIHGFDGEYPMDDDVGWTMRELNIIKRIAGVRAGEIQEALEAGDSDVVGAIAVIAVRQSGKDEKVFERLLWDSSFASIDIGDDSEEGSAGEAVPLIPTPPHSDSGSEAQHDGSTATSSGGGEDLQETNLRAIGSQGSAAG